MRINGLSKGSYSRKNLDFGLLQPIPRCGLFMEFYGNRREGKGKGGKGEGGGKEAIIVRARIIGPCYDVGLSCLSKVSCFFLFPLSRGGGRFLVCFSPFFQRRKFQTT